MKYFAQKLKQLRKIHGINQEQLASKIGVTRASIASWEISRAEPSLAKLCEIADVFDVSVDSLLR